MRGVVETGEEPGGGEVGVGADELPIRRCRQEAVDRKSVRILVDQRRVGV